MRSRTIRIFMLVAAGLLAAACSRENSSTSAASSPSTTSPPAIASPNPDTVVRHLYLGQIYPSGHVYLVPFPLLSHSQSAEDYRRHFHWPKSISLHAIVDGSPVTDNTKPGDFVRVLHDSQQGDTTHSPYIPALEAMNESHKPCGEDQTKGKENPRYRYLDNDFFEQEMDNCNVMEGTAVYKADKPGVFSFSVIGFDSKAPLSDFKLFAETPRPMTHAEKRAVAGAKEHDKEADGNDCETEPNYLDSAMVMMTAKVSGTDLTIRLSTYKDPGCNGDLGAYYLIDVLKHGKRIKKYKMLQYMGGV